MADSFPSKPNDGPPELPIVRFGLRRMFLFVTVVGVLLVLMARSPGIGKLALPLIAALVFLHVLSTLIGNRLRALADDRLDWQEKHGIIDGEVLPATRLSQSHASLHRTPETPLRRRDSLPAWPRRKVLAGAIVGGVVGAILLATTIGYRISPLGIATGAMSTAILGGWLVFIGSNFWSIARHTWREAMAHERLDESRRRADCRGDGDGI
jgi:hypothetical protein